MPEMDGFEVCGRLKADEQLREIPVIFISALDDIDNKVRAFSQGGVDYLPKPFQKEEILARVKTHLRLRRQQIDIEAQKQEIQKNYVRLRELEDHRDKLVHMIVHDMRSPLMGILGNTELLEMELKGKGHAKMVSNVEGIKRSGRILQEMISTLLDISRLESNKMPLEKETCDLRSIISKALDSLGGLVRETTLVYEAPSEIVSVFCDPEITGRIVQNLVSNAIKFTGKNGEVRIFLLREQGRLKVKVSDTGPGIPPEYHQRIFEKFGQVAAGKEVKKYSTGLGLTFCKLAVEAQGGQISVSSEVGKGSTFCFTIPTGLI
jgi:signal transduction histidine kinase